ncbi:membrane protein insertion efficiency factor YidD [Litorimonas haliclonae]|uniref:membrane protein insertion efficiency factor YidD n=1 Tax=Litorimonas haliclonae TaxID=2081977 RepID=UPI0039EFB088
MERLLSYPLLGLLWIYKNLISPFLFALGVRCRHYPSCSTYSAEAIKRHGPWPGGWMTLARLLRCRPGGTSGVDNVPEHITKAPLWAPWRYGRWRSVNDE